jgi:hypothetical protein
VTRFTRQRFREICQGKRPGDFGILGDGFNQFWPETLQMWAGAWGRRGAPAALATLADGQDGILVDACPALEEYLQFDEMRTLREIDSGQKAGNVMLRDFHGVTFQDLSFMLSPPYEPTLLEEDERSITYMSRAGIKQRLLREASFGMPEHLEYPVRDRATWDRYKERLDPATPERYPADWDAYVKEIGSLDRPVQMEVGGFFGFINMWVGTENLMYLFYDDPSLVDDMMEHLLVLETAMVRRVMRDIRVDIVRYYEDMAYRAGPMISPAMVRKHMLPRYRALNQVIREAGCDVFFLDSDGNIEQLIPLWLEAGINFFAPLECSAGMDPVALRKKYGPDVIFSGGLDKREFMRDKESLREEVMKKVPFLVESGPYFPTLDHLVPPTVPFENFCYYIDLLREIRGDEQLTL